MKTRTLGLAALAVMVLAGGGFAAWKSFGNGGNTPQYKLAKAETGPLTALVSATGTLNPVVSVQVGSQVSGQIKEIMVDFNSPVKAGQLIARLDPETYQHRVRQVEADLDAARANQGVQQAEVARARANLSNAQRDYERKKTLVEKNFISPAERDTAQNTLEASRAALASAEAQVRNGEAIVRQRESQLASARVDLERTIIRAPVDGTVVKRSIEPGQTVAASLQAPELFVIARNLTDMQVETSIDEADVGRVRVGQKVSFTVDAFAGRHFEGEVRQVRKAATVVSNVVTYTIVVSAANPDLTLLPGMTANVRIVTAQKDAALKVPNAALRFRPPSAAGSTAAVSSAPTSAAGTSAPGSGQKDRLVAELKLDADQQAKLDPIFADMRAKLQASRELPDAEKSKAQERSRAEMREKVALILTPAQKLRYDEMNADAAANRAGGGGGTGRIWMVGEDGKAKGIDVRLGLTDGSMTEIVAGDIKAGQEVIVGLQTVSGAKPSAAPGPRLF